MTKIKTYTIYECPKCKSRHATERNAIECCLCKKCHQFPMRGYSRECEACGVDRELDGIKQATKQLSTQATAAEKNYHATLRRLNGELTKLEVRGARLERKKEALKEGGKWPQKKR